MINNNFWTKVTKGTLPPEGKIVLTRKMDSFGERNVQKLVRKGNLWFVPDMSMYVYYTPDEWKAVV